FDAAGVHLHPASGAVGRRARLVQTEMTVQTDAEQREIEAVADAPVIIATNSFQVRRVGRDEVKLLVRQINVVDQETSQYVHAFAFVVGRQAAVIVEREYFRVAKRNQAALH